MKLNSIAVNLLLAAVSAIIGLLLCELGARLFLDPVDYLTPSYVRDEILGFKLLPETSGHDEWGFRNREVPPTAEIVALGDSHTYGNCARMSESWPAVLEQLSGRLVYNLGLGGYGPNQYYYLFTTRALSLKPAAVICGLYLGDDFENAYSMTYGLDYWKSYRDQSGSRESADWDIWEKSQDEAWHKELRDWLSRESIIYRLTVHGLFSEIKGRFQVQNASRLYESTSTLIVEDRGIREAFRPESVLVRLDQDRSDVREGMRITFRLLTEMEASCREHGIKFIVAVIPTKESVFSAYIENNREMALSESIDRVIFNEREARVRLLAFLRERDIAFIDLLPALQHAVDREKLYTNSAVDMHPNRNGYRVIASAIADFMSADPAAGPE